MQFTAAAESQSLGRIILQLDRTLEQLGPQGVSGRELLKSKVLNHRERFWGDARGARISYQISRADSRDMGDFFATVTPKTDDERTALANAKELWATMIQTQLLMMRQLANPVPPILVYMVFGWAMLLFAADAFISTFNGVSFVAAALGAVAVSSALLLIFLQTGPIRLSHRSDPRPPFITRNACSRETLEMRAMKRMSS